MKLEETYLVDAFLSGISVTMKSFLPYFQNIAKHKIFVVVSKVDMQQIMNPVTTPVTIIQPNYSQFNPTFATHSSDSE